MTLRCSILGHNYGAAEVDRDREEDGSEVVTTVRETETCIRCGETRVVSENKEVTTLETPADIVADDLEPGADGAEDPPEQAGDDGLADPKSDVETSIPDAEESVPSVGTPPATDPAEDDGVILEDETAEREPGEWPAEPDDDDDEWEPETTSVHDDPEIERTGNAVTVPEGSFRCPECDFSTDVEASSLRVGDFCPECHRGALEHHPE